MLREWTTVARFSLMFGGLMAVAGVWIAVGPLASAEDKPPAAAATVEFADTDPAPGVEYHLKCVIELIDTDKKFTVNSDIGAGSHGEAIRLSIEGVLKMKKEWTYKGEGKKWVIEGWKDPKTGTFYKVKKVTFTSPDLPKDQMPKVTN